MAFSRDGRLLAITSKYEERYQIDLYEVATWTWRNAFDGHRDRTTALAFAPNGQLLSGGLDTTVLAWNTRPPRSLAVSLENDWKVNFAEWQSDKSLVAEGHFPTAPAEAVKFFAEKIAPATTRDANRKLKPEQLRQTRAVYVLELIGNDDSKKLLKKLAGGFKGARLTEEAAAAVQRLEGMPDAKR